jgi:uncharacterized protein YcbX
MHDPRDGKRVGRVAGLWRDPVKSMAAEEQAEANVSWHGFAGDRRRACLGIYGSTVEPGRIAVNDPVLVESPA